MRIPEQADGDAQLALALPHIPARHAPDHQRSRARPSAFIEARTSLRHQAIAAWFRNPELR